MKCRCSRSAVMTCGSMPAPCTTSSKKGQLKKKNQKKNQSCDITPCIQKALGGHMLCHIVVSNQSCMGESRMYTHNVEPRHYLRNDSCRVIRGIPNIINITQVDLCKPVFCEGYRLHTDLRIEHPNLQLQGLHSLDCVI